MFGIPVFELAVFALIILVVLFVFKGIVTVNQGFEYTVERLGRFTPVVAPGYSFYRALH